MYDRIVVPIPEGTGADALDRARLLARVLNSKLTLLHVHNPREAPTELEGLPQYRYQHVVESWDGRDADAQAREAEWLARLADRIARREPGLVVGSRVVHAPLGRCVRPDGERVLAVVAVDDVAEPLDLAAQQLIRSCGVPVLLHRPEHSVLPIRRILVALDGSSFSEESLGPAIELARSTGARITLAEVVPHHSGLVRILHPAERTVAAAERSLREAAARVPAGLGHVELRVIEHQSPAEGIMREAERDDIDLVAMATHGRGGLRRLLFGSVAERVLASSPVPVLVFRPQAMGADTPDVGWPAGSVSAGS